MEDPISSALVRALVVGLPVVVLLGLSISRFARTRTPSALLQLLGAACLIIVVLTHVAEALHALPSMGWGEPRSIGHYIDLVSGVLGAALLVAAFVLWLARRMGL